MRKGLIIAGLAVWLVLLLAGIAMRAFRSRESPNGEVAELMQQEPEVTAKAEEGVPSEPESTAERTTAAEEATVSTELEAPACISEKSVDTPVSPSYVPETNYSPAKPETEQDTPAASDPAVPTEVQQIPTEALPDDNPDGPHSFEQETEPEESGETANAVSSFKACDSVAGSVSPLRYWLYVPSNPTENMPLIVYLHGGSGKGSDLSLITAVDGFPRYLQSGLLGDVRAYVVIPQLPSDQKGWAGAHDALYSLIQYMVSQYGIDTGKISLTGHSMGGTGTWSLAAAYPSLFSRIAPLSGSVRNIGDTACALKDVSVWAFVGSEDTIIPPESSEEVISLLRESDADARITVLDGADHFTVPSLTYLNGEINLIGWLIG